ncbi:MAG: class poly(R)-hydroxyalkanoic acid synthase subunit PhaE [Pseudomonadota bacterium]
MTMAWNNDTLRDWSDAQQRAWQTWAAAAKTGEFEQLLEASPAKAWADSIQQHWKTLAPQLEANASADAVQRMLEMGKVYMGFAENACKVPHSSVVSAETVDTWLNTLESGFRGCCNQLDAGKFTAHGVGVGQVAMDSWQRVLKSLGMQAFQHLGAGGFQMPLSENWQEQLQKVLATPAVGLNRESQERWQALAQLATEYQTCADDYLKAFAKQGLSAVATLRERIQQLRDDGKVITSLRELYDLWVEVNEDAYGKFAMTDEYQVVYGDMVNALMALKQGINHELNDWYQSMNLPTHKELNEAFKKQQELRRENRQLRQQLQALTRKVDALIAAQVLTSEA